MTATKLKRTQVAAARLLMMKQQNYLCLLCDADFRQQTMKGRKRVVKFLPALDHCHSHGHVRGVLCVNCNGREGEIWNRAQRCKRGGTAIEWMARLLAYWIKHETPQTKYIHPDHKSDDDKRLAKNAAERKKRAQAKAVALLNARK